MKKEKGETNRKGEARRTGGEAAACDVVSSYGIRIRIRLLVQRFKAKAKSNH